MEIDLAAQIVEDISTIKERIAAIPQLELSQHNQAFEEIHNLLQQALSNLDGI
jgi:hypothetical protein